MKTKFTLILSAAAILCSCQISRGEEKRSIVCRSIGIKGFDQAAEQAESSIGRETTRVLSKMKVYLTVANGWVYLHSNFISEDAYLPTKIASNDVRNIDLPNLLLNIYSFGRPSNEQLEVFKSGMRKIRIVVDHKSFVDSEYVSLMNEAVLW